MIQVLMELISVEQKHKMYAKTTTGCDRYYNSGGKPLCSTWDLWWTVKGTCETQKLLIRSRYFRQKEMPRIRKAKGRSRSTAVQLAGSQIQKGTDRSVSDISWRASPGFCRGGWLPAQGTCTQRTVNREELEASEQRWYLIMARFWGNLHVGSSAKRMNGRGSRTLVRRSYSGSSSGNKGKKKQMQAIHLTTNVMRSY